MEKDIEKQKGITISDILGAIRKSWILLLIIIVSVTVIGAIYTFGFVKTKYYAEGSVSVEYKDSNDSLDTANSLRYVNTIGDFSTSESILTKVSERLSSKYSLSVTSLRKVISASYSTDAMIISYKVTTTNPTQSQDIVKALVENKAFLDKIREYLDPGELSMDWVEVYLLKDPKFIKTLTALITVIQQINEGKLDSTVEKEIDKRLIYIKDLCHHHHHHSHVINDNNNSQEAPSNEDNSTVDENSDNNENLDENIEG